ncbi:hypothetical protein [Paenibacillus profundus]|uniref:hypothetical protein n=1 Tax=Paenibacillus profundus TaxID=1173085 RepID=UPI001F16C2BD|nr:hypothetical protein [Paenibacillus profundus]
MKVTKKHVSSMHLTVPDEAPESISGAYFFIFIEHEKGGEEEDGKVSDWKNTDDTASCLHACHAMIAVRAYPC